MQAPFPRNRPAIRGILGTLALWAASPIITRAQEVPLLVTDLNTATRDASPGGLTVSGGSLYFGATDGLEGAFGGELWKTGGTAPGTVLVKDIAPGPQGRVRTS